MSYTYIGTQIVSFRPFGDHTWTRKAACAEEFVDLMFPHETDDLGIEAAKSVCNGCPVRSTCLEGALDRDEKFGVWGGMTEAERRSVKRKTVRQSTTKG